MSTPVPPLDVGDIDALLRHTEHGLSAYLETTEEHSQVDGTMATSFCHVLQRDATGTVRINDLAKLLAASMVDYAIPRSKIAEARKKDAQYNTLIYTQKLADQARSLFTDLKNTGEGGEFLLYLLTQEFLKVPQFLCKMPLKTSGHMHYHGVDGVHIGCEPNKDGHNVPAFYWGESKIHADLGSGLKESLETLSQFLSPGQVTSTTKNRDLELMHDNIDLQDPALENVILQYLDKDNPLFNQAIYKGVVLVGFEQDEYNSLKHDELVGHCKAEFKKWLEKAKTLLHENNLQEVTMHIFFLPFPSVQGFRDTFLKELHIQ